MATIGTNAVTAISRRWILDSLTDNVYKSNPLLYRWLRANKRLVRGGFQLEAPLMYARFAAGGFYSGLDQLDITPSDMWQNGSWLWKQCYVPVTVDGLTLIKTDQPEAVADFMRMYFQQAEMEMCELIGSSLWSDGVSNTKNLDGLKGAVDDSTVLTTYAGISRTANTWWKSQIDTSTTTLSLTSMNTMFGNCTAGGRHPTVIVMTQANYNRFWVLNQAFQAFPTEPAGVDQQLAQPGFTNQVFSGVPVLVDSHVPANHIFFLNEDFFYFVVSSRADFYLEDFIVPSNQDAMTAKLLFAGNILLTNCSLQGKMTALTA